MKITPNLGWGPRIFYVVSGVALIVGPFALALGALWRWILPIVGVVAIVEGLVGW
jgi:hypothetical protein